MRLALVPETRLVYVYNDPGIPSGMTEDVWAGLCGWHGLARAVGMLDEGKAIGSASMKANVGERDLSMRFLPREQVRQTIQRARGNAGRALNRVYGVHRATLLSVISEYVAGNITRKKARIDSAHAIRSSYERVREIARRASGIEQLAHESRIYKEEEQWFRSAVREEVGYFHAFLEDIRRKRAFNIAERVEAYTKALRFMYEAARVQAMPDSVLLYWVGTARQKDDPHVCDGCEYMLERSPFPKDIIPAVPRDGSTQCLTNCRHRIIVRVVEDLNDIVRRRHVLGKSKSMIRRLQEIKEGAGLGRAMPKTKGTAKNPFKGQPLTRATAARVRRRV